MTVSGSWVFSVSRDDIVKEAMQNVGALGEGETPTAQEVTDCARKLNMLVKQWMGSQDFAPGLKMWERQRAELFLTSAQGVYELGPNTLDNWGYRPGKRSVELPYGATFLAQDTLALATSLFVDNVSGASVGDNIGVFIGPDIFWSRIIAIAPDAKNIQISPPLPSAAASGNPVYNYTTRAQRPLGIVTCLLRDQFGNDTPLNSMTIQEYEALPTKVQPGYVADPSAFYYETQFESGNSPAGGGLLFLDIYGAQDTTKHIHIVYIRPVMDFTAPLDNPEYPQQWYRALCWGLSREIVPMFDAEWTPEMQANHEESLAMAREADSETTNMYFQPNSWDDFGV